MWCLDCDYELINLEEARCPECGRAFDAQDPTTFKTEAVVAETRSRGVSWVAAAAGAAIGIATSTLLTLDSAVLRASVGAIAGAVGGVLATVVVGLIWRERKSSADS